MSISNNSNNSNNNEVRNNERGESAATLNSHDIVGHSKFLDSILIFIMKINVGHSNFQLTLKL